MSKIRKLNFNSNFHEYILRFDNEYILYVILGHFISSKNKESLLSAILGIMNGSEEVRKCLKKRFENDDSDLGWKRKSNNDFNDILLHTKILAGYYWWFFYKHMTIYFKKGGFWKKKERKDFVVKCFKKIAKSNEKELNNLFIDFPDINNRSEWVEVNFVNGLDLEKCNVKGYEIVAFKLNGNYKHLNFFDHIRRILDINKEIKGNMFKLLSRSATNMSEELLKNDLIDYTDGGKYITKILTIFGKVKSYNKKMKWYYESAKIALQKLKQVMSCKFDECFEEFRSEIEKIENISAKIRNKVLTKYRKKFGDMFKKFNQNNSIAVLCLSEYDKNLDKCVNAYLLSLEDEDVEISNWFESSRMGKFGKNQIMDELQKLVGVYLKKISEEGFTEMKSIDTKVGSFIKTLTASNIYPEEFASKSKGYKSIFCKNIDESSNVHTFVVYMDYKSAEIEVNVVVDLKPGESIYTHGEICLNSKKMIFYKNELFKIESLLSSGIGSVISVDPGLKKIMTALMFSEDGNIFKLEQDGSNFCYEAALFRMSMDVFVSIEKRFVCIIDSIIEAFQTFNAPEYKIIADESLVDLDYCDVKEIVNEGLVYKEWNFSKKKSNDCEIVVLSSKGLRIISGFIFKILKLKVEIKKIWSNIRREIGVGDIMNNLKKQLENKHWSEIVQLYDFRFLFEKLPHPLCEIFREVAFNEFDNKSKVKDMRFKKKKDKFDLTKHMLKEMGEVVLNSKYDAKEIIAKWINSKDLMLLSILLQISKQMKKGLSREFKQEMERKWEKFKNKRDEIHRKNSIIFCSSSLMLLEDMEIISMVEKKKNGLNIYWKTGMISFGFYKQKQLFKSNSYKSSCTIVCVPSFYNSQACHRCFNLKDFNGRTSKCSCGSVIDRDVGACMTITSKFMTDTNFLDYSEFEPNFSPSKHGLKQLKEFPDDEDIEMVTDLKKIENGESLSFKRIKDAIGETFQPISNEFRKFFCGIIASIKRENTRLTRK